MNLNGFELAMKTRETVGTSAARGLRKAAAVPVTIYGKSIKALSVSVDEAELKRALATKTLFNMFTNLVIDGKKMIGIAKIVQKHPVTDRVLHADFQAVTKEEVVKTKVPLRFLNKELCEAIKLGGQLNVVCAYLELMGKAADMPAYLDCDLKNAKIGISIRVSDLTIPNGIKLVKSEAKTVVATILASRKKGGAVEEEQAAEAAA